ncbi:MAG: hypothetical protein ACYS9T_07225 [Planctomycetota bacterium]|jgi:hypothetical protein
MMIDVADNNAVCPQKLANSLETRPLAGFETLARRQGDVMHSEMLKRRVRYIIAFFMCALAASGLTALPLCWELDILQTTVGEGTFMERLYPPMAHWISFVHANISSIAQESAFIFYGTDWLAFAHIVIAIAFFGPFRDPVKNVWVIEFGIIACLLVIPVALIAGQIRGIPFFWRLIDCSFGVIGVIPLIICRRYIKQMKQLRLSD